MAEEKEAPALPERATQAQTRPATVPLSEFKLRPEMFSHRDPENLTNRDRLKPLMDSLITEGLQNPVEFARDADGRPVPTKGHRRISAMRHLARENAPGFTEDMPIAAVEVLNATPQDLLTRPVSDNVVRQNLTMGERIRAAKAMHEGGVEANRAAFALGYSTKQYLSDLRLAQQGWMLEHVEADNVGHGAAGEVLEAAEKVNPVPDLKAHLDSWIAARKLEMAGGKEKKLKGLLTKRLSDHWAQQLREEKPLDDVVAEPEEFQADIDAGANRVMLDVKLDLLNAPLESLEKAEFKLQQVLTVVAKYRQARGAVEGPEGPQALARQAAVELNRRTTEVAGSGRGEGATPPEGGSEAEAGE